MEVSMEERRKAIFVAVANGASYQSLGNTYGKSRETIRQNYAAALRLLLRRLQNSTEVCSLNFVIKLSKASGWNTFVPVNTNIKAITLWFVRDHADRFTAAAEQFKLELSDEQYQQWLKPGVSDVA